MSQGFLNNPPTSRSGAIQLRPPTMLSPPMIAVRLVTSALIRERPKSHRTALPLSSISTLSWKKIPVRKAKGQKENKRVYYLRPSDHRGRRFSNGDRRDPVIYGGAECTI